MKFIERFCPRREMPYARLNTTATGNHHHHHHNHHHHNTHLLHHPNYPHHHQLPNQSAAEIQLQSLDANTLLLSHDKCVNYNAECLTGASPSPSGSSLDLEWECEYGDGNRSNHHQSWLPLAGGGAGGADGDVDDDDDGPDSLGNGVIGDIGAGETTIDEMSSCDDDGMSSGQSNKHTPTRKMKRSNMRDSNNLHKSLLQFKSIGVRDNIRAMSKTSGSHISTPDSLEWDVQEEEQTYKSETDDGLDMQTLELLEEIECWKNRTLDETSPRTDHPATSFMDS